MVNERGWLALIFSLYFLLAVGYSLLMPIWEAPDEPAHYHLAWYLARKHNYASYQVNYEAQQPRMFYYLGSWVIRALDKVNPKFSDYYLPKEFKYNIRIPVRRFEWSDENYRFLLGVYALRWINIVFGGLALWVNWKTFKQIAPEKPILRLGALAFAALTPQYLHIMSSVNNDALGTLAGASLFYLAIQVTRESSNLLDLLSIVLALVLALTTKLTVLAISAALMMIVIWKWFFGLKQQRWLILSCLVILLSVGIFYIFFPETTQSAISEIKWRLFSFRKNAFTYEYAKFILGQIIETYWGKVGWLAVGLPTWIFKFLTVVGLIGMLLHTSRLIKSGRGGPHFNSWIATWLVALFTILAVIRNGLTTNATQGRFLFPAIGALTLLMVVGWHDVLPERAQHYLPLVVIIFMLGCTLILWQFGILPVYYQPFLD
jgi:hypothetical protein